MAWGTIALLALGGFAVYEISQSGSSKKTTGGTPPSPPPPNCADPKDCATLVSCATTAMSTATVADIPKLSDLITKANALGCKDLADQIAKKIGTLGTGGVTPPPIPPVPSIPPVVGPALPPFEVPLPPSGLFTHALTVEDLMLRPLGFALAAGFSGIDDFGVANPSISFSALDSTGAARFPTDPSIYETVGVTEPVRFFKASPWFLGQNVFTKRDMGKGFIPTPPAPIPFVTGETAPLPFGGNGFGQSNKRSFV